MKTVTNSDLMWRVSKIHNIGEKYIKARILFFYKSTGDVCYWLNTDGKPKNFKILKENYDQWTTLYDTCGFCSVHCGNDHCITRRK